MQEEHQYTKGIKSLMIRCYFYIEQGLNVLNMFRNLFLGIFGLYITLKFTNYMYMVAMVFGSLPILAIVGYYSVHKINKTKEWLNIKFSTHYAMKTFDYNKDTAESLKKILAIMEKTEGETLYKDCQCACHFTDTPAGCGCGCNKHIE